MVAATFLSTFLLSASASAFAQASAPSGSLGGVQAGVQSVGQANASPVTAPSASNNSVPTAGESLLYPGEDFKLSPGDLISISVFLQPDYSYTVRVSSEGTAQLPLIGSIPVQGLNVREAQNLIAQRLREGGYFNDPVVTIRVLDTVNGTVVITGEIHAIVPVTTQRSLREVLLIAGGLPANASHTVKIVRPGVKEPISVELGPDLAASSAANIPIRPHDIIQISRANVVYVLGAFARQGAVPLDQSSPLTLLQLAALSGGINFEGQYNDLRLIRTVGNERRVVQVNIKNIRDGKAPDPVLQANDIVFLPTNSMKALLKNTGSGGILGLVSILLFSAQNL